MAIGAELVDHVVDERAGRAERHDDRLGVVGVAGDVARLAPGELSYFSATSLPVPVGAGPGVLCLPWRHVQITFERPVPPLLPSSAHGLSGGGAVARPAACSIVIWVKPIMWSA